MAVFRQLTEQYFDNSSNPLAGGLIYTYAAGTTTPKATYTDQGGLTSNANPVVLDSAGRASIWLNGNYKIVIKDSSGTQLKSEDNIAGYAEVDFTGLTALSSELNYNTGAIAGTVVASKSAVVDSNKDIGNFRNLTSVNLIATTKTTSPIVQTPAIYDNNGVAAITIASTASQVNAITLTPNITTANPKLAASGTDTNIILELDGKGAAGIRAVAPGSAAPLKLNKNAVAFDASIDLAVLTAARTYTLPDLALDNFLVQVQRTATGAVSSGTTVLPWDDTIPQSSEGDQYMSLAITPRSATSILEIEVVAHVDSSITTGAIVGALFQDATANAIAAAAENVSSAAQGTALRILYYMTSGTTSATTFKFRAGPSAAATVTFNGAATARKLGGVMNSYIIIREYVS